MICHSNSAKSLIKSIQNSEVGLFDLPVDQNNILNSIRNYVKTLDKEIDTFLLIGIGGSSLGCITIDSALSKIDSNKKFICLDNVDSDLIEKIFTEIDVTKTLVNVVSKSGGTPETMSNFMIVYNKFKSKLDVKYQIILSLQQIHKRES